jgi:hypothetical protein
MRSPMASSTISRATCMKSRFAREACMKSRFAREGFGMALSCHELSADR